MTRYQSLPFAPETTTNVSPTHGKNETSRWYDQNTQISASVTLMQRFPLIIQEILCRGLLLLTEEQIKTSEYIENYKTVGSERILSIYKSKQKRRTYDRNPVVHRMMNYLCLLSTENRLFVSDKIVELVRHTKQYLSICREYKQTPSESDLNTLTSTYIKKGSIACQDFLSTLEKAFIEFMESESTSKEKQSKIQALDSELRVSTKNQF